MTLYAWLLHLESDNLAKTEGAPCSLKHLPGTGGTTLLWCENEKKVVGEQPDHESSATIIKEIATGNGEPLPVDYPDLSGLIDRVR